MIHKKIARLWNRNARDWIKASESGLDVWRDQLNTQAFLSLLPDVAALSGLDIGCGEGHNTRLIAQRCQQLTAVDISREFIAHNRKIATANIEFMQANWTQLPFPDDHFDFVVSTMAFMDMAEFDKALAELYRVLRPQGFLQFSITHPCFNEFIGHWLEDRSGFLVENYFMQTDGAIQQWQHLHAPELKPFQTPRFVKPLSHWLMPLIQAGFMLEAIHEPVADTAAIERYPALASSLIAAHSLMIRVRK